LRKGNVDTPKQCCVAEIRATYGKYTGKPSLTQALLKERQEEERTRNESKPCHGKVET
jgi:hypothetical protein